MFFGLFVGSNHNSDDGTRLIYNKYIQDGYFFTYISPPLAISIFQLFPIFSAFPATTLGIPVQTTPQKSKTDVDIFIIIILSLLPLKNV